MKRNEEITDTLDIRYQSQHLSTGEKVIQVFTYKESNLDHEGIYGLTNIGRVVMMVQNMWGVCTELSTGNCANG